MRQKRQDQEIRSLSEFKTDADFLVRQLQETHRTLVLTEQGHNVAVVMEANEFEAMKERLEMLEEIHLAEQQLAAGEGFPHEEAKAQVLKRLSL